MRKVTFLFLWISGPVTGKKIRDTTSECAFVCYYFINMNQIAATLQLNSGKCWKSPLFTCINLLTTLFEPRVLCTVDCTIVESTRGNECNLFYCPNVCREVLEASSTIFESGTCRTRSRRDGWSFSRYVWFFRLTYSYLIVIFCLKYHCRQTAVCNFIYIWEKGDETRIRIWKRQKPLWWKIFLRAVNILCTNKRRIGWRVCLGVVCKVYCINKFSPFVCYSWGWAAEHGADFHHLCIRSYEID